MPLNSGEWFAGFRIIRLLGSGGMGEVYLAQHPRLPRRNALKVLPAEVSADADYRARFNREADLASTLYHPHIVSVHDRGEHDGQLWISMDFVDGADAARLMADRFPAGMPPDLVIRIVSAVASALDYAHKQGLLHRDVKPANIMLTHVDDDDDEQRILLADFGIARNVDDISGLTLTNTAMGTVAYAAPEQLMGEDIDGRADQYALAATAHHLLTGSELFPHLNPAVVISRHLNSSPPALAASRAELAPLDAALVVALAKDPNDRYSRCVGLSRALTRASAERPTSLLTGEASPLGVAPTQPAQVTAEPPTTATEDPAPTPRAVRPRPTSQLPLPDSSVETFGTRDVSVPARRWPRTVGAVVVILLLVAVAFVVRPWQHDRAGNDNTTTTSPSGFASLTFDNMRDFVTSYYSDLPAKPNDAWNKLDPHCQSQTGESQFVNFWATIQSVTLVSVTPRDATSVTARLTYMRRDGTTDTEDRWLRMALVNGTVLLDESGRIGTVSTTVSPTPSTAPEQVSAIDTVLATPTEIDRIVGANGFQVKNSTDQLMDQSYQVTPSSCVGVIFGAESIVYTSSGYAAVRDQTLQPASYPYNDTGLTLVEQTAIAFKTPEQAQSVLASSQRQWQSCAAGLVSYRVPNTNGEVGWSFNFGPVALRDNILTVSMAGINRESGNNACQQALGARANVVVTARTCLAPDNIPTTATVADPNLAGRNAEQLAQNLLNRVQ